MAPRINLYDQRTVAQSAKAPHLRAVELGDGGAAKGLAMVANALDEKARLDIQIEEDDARVYVSKAMAEARAKANEIQRTAFAEAQDGWRGATQRVGKDWSALREGALQKAPTAAAQRFLLQAFDAYQPLMLEDTAEREYGARQSWRLDTVREAIKTEGSAIAADPRLYEQAVAQQTELIAGMADLTADQRRDLLAGMNEEFAVTYVSAMVERDPSGALKALNDPKAEGAYASLSGSQRRSLATAAENEIERRRAKWETGVRDVVSNQIELMKLGVPVKPDERLSLNTVRSALGEGYAASYELALTSYDRQQTMLTAPSADLAGILARPAVVPQGKEDVRALLLDRADKQAAANVLEMRAKDPMGYLINSGLVDPTPGAMGARGGRSPADAFTAIKTGDWESLSAVLRSRKAALETTGAKLGLAPLPLTSQEAAALGGSLSMLPPDAQADALSRLATTLGPQSRAYRGLMGQIAGQTSGSVGYAGYLAGQERTLTNGLTGDKAARALLNGQSILSPVKDGETGAKPGKFAMPSEGDLREKWVDYIGGKSASEPSIYRGMPNAEAGSYDAFRAAYAGLASERGVTDGKIDPKIAKEAASIATGGVGSVYGTRTALPWGLTGKDVEARIERGWDKIVTAYPSLRNTQPKDFDYLIAGDGRYLLLEGDAPVMDNGREVAINIGR